VTLGFGTGRAIATALLANGVAVVPLCCLGHGGTPQQPALRDSWLYDVLLLGLVLALKLVGVIVANRHSARRRLPVATAAGTLVCTCVIGACVVLCYVVSNIAEIYATARR